MKLEFLTDGKRHLVCRPYSVQNLHLMASIVDSETLLGIISAAGGDA